MSASILLISCEHAAKAVPPDLAPLFAGREDLLDSHRGYDPGALTVARALAAATGAPLFATAVSRLVVDCNRSPGHRGLFSEITRGLPRAAKKALLEAWYRPHREAVAKAVAAGLEAGGTVLHLACHSFTPVLHGVVRRCDLGFLYDPARPAELALCRAWKAALAKGDPALVLRANYPYKGVSDGLTTGLRRRFGEGYRGVELEMNQRFVRQGPSALTGCADRLVASLARVAPGLFPAA